MKKAEKARIVEQEEFEKKYILDALADIRASLDSSIATIATYGKAYEAMLRLKDRFGCSTVDLVFTWLRGTNRRNGPAPGMKERYGKEVFNFLKRQPIPIPHKGLEEYQQLWHLYIHPELEGAESLLRDGKFSIEEGSLLVTRNPMDGIFRTFPNEGPWQLYDSYLEALEAKSSLIYSMMSELDAKLEYVRNEISKEKEARDA